MVSGFWQWLHDTSPGQATFIGSVFGFLALLGGACANASLNRRRDDRLRREDQRAVATALRAELAGCRAILVQNAETLKKPGYLVPEENFLMADLAHAIRILPHMIPKLGLLDEETIDRVTNAYLALEEHGARLLLLGGRLVDPAVPEQAIKQLQSRGAVGETRRTSVSLSADLAPQVIVINNNTAETIQEAIDRLDVVLRATAPRRSVTRLRCWG
jgi:hypothetical protein